MEAEGRGVDPVNEDATALQGAHPEKRLQQRALPRARAADDAQARAARNCEGDAIQNRRKIRPVAHGDVLEADLPGCGPGFEGGIHILLQLRLRFQLRVAGDALDGDEAQLCLRQALQEGLHGLRELQGVPQHEPDLCARDGQPEHLVAGLHDQGDGHSGDWDGANSAEPHAEPPIAHHDVEHEADVQGSPLAVAVYEERLLLVSADARHADDGLVEALVDRALAAAGETLQLARRGAEGILQPVVQADQGHHDNDQVGRRHHDDAATHKERDQVVREARQCALGLHVELLHILREAVDDAASRRGVEPRHRRPEHSPKRSRVQCPRDLQRRRTEESHAPDDGAQRGDQQPGEEA
mmetsp:Transcript_119214/g.344840  ORF Transcript_119214/g.344840 Transcript_119214/m.344840 type:complete len:355 (-) Transcript_119214:308-1372(-)